MRAPLSDIVLLMYSIIGPQLFGNSEIEMYLNSHEIDQILTKNINKNPTSSIFLFLKAKYCELHLINSEKAIEYIQAVQKNSIEIREIQSIAWFELGFLNLMKFNYSNARDCFDKFSKDSKWSPSFNIFIDVILRGCQNDLDNLKNDVNSALLLSHKKNFVEKVFRFRLQYLSQLSSITQSLCELLFVEVLYLWLYIPYCDPQCLHLIIECKYDADNIETE